MRERKKKLTFYFFNEKPYINTEDSFLHFFVLGSIIKNWVIFLRNITKKKKKSNRKIITWRERERDYYTLGLKSYVLVQRTKYLCFKKKKKKETNLLPFMTNKRQLWVNCWSQKKKNYESIVAKK